MKRLTHLFFAFFCMCSQAEEPVDYCEIKQQSTQVQAKLSSWNSDVLSNGVAFAIEKHGYPVSLSERISDMDVGTEGGACGEEYTGFFKTLDPDKDKGLDIAYEIDANGKVINKWVYPYNWYVLAVDGDSIIVPYRASTICRYGENDPFIGSAIKISTKGTIELLVKPEDSAYETTQCPKTNLFQDSAYKGCAVYTDITNKTKRTLLVQWPCT